MSFIQKKEQTNLLSNEQPVLNKNRILIVESTEQYSTDNLSFKKKTSI